ncbi:MAG: NADH-quinone oxidoreductase subunit NuoK [candidate division NC10 bacterium]
MVIPVSYYLVLGAVLFGIGMFGVLTRRNAIAILMAVELMLNAVNINFIAFSRYLPNSTLDGQVFAIFVIAVAAAEAAVGLAIVLGLYRNFHTVNVDEINLMKW